MEAFKYLVKNLIKKLYLVYIPIIALVLCFAVMFSANVALDKSLRASLELSGKLNPPINDMKSLADEIKENAIDSWKKNQLEKQIKSAILYGNPDIESYSDAINIYPMLPKSSLTDHEIATALGSKVLKPQKDKASADPLKTLKESKILPKVRADIVEKAKMAFYLRRVINGHIQFITVYFTLVAIGFWCVMWSHTGCYLTLVSKNSRLYRSTGDESVQFFIKQGNNSCTLTKLDDGLDSVPIHIDSADSYKLHKVDGKYITKEAMNDQEQGAFSHYLNGINECVNKIQLSTPSMAEGPFHIIQEICNRAKLNGLVEDAVAALDEQLDAFHSRLERKATFFPFWIWLVPTIGFVGTIYGISGALESAHNVVSVEPGLRGGTTQGLTATLGIAFDTTLLALLCSIPLMFLMLMHQWKMEFVVNTLRVIITQRVIDGLKNAHTVDERLVRYDELMTSHMRQIESELTKQVAQLFVNKKVVDDERS